MHMCMCHVHTEMMWLGVRSLPPSVFLASLSLHVWLFVCVVVTQDRDLIMDELGPLLKLKERKYGRTILVIYGPTL